MTTRQKNTGKTKGSPKPNNSKATPKSAKTSPKVAKKPTEVARSSPRGQQVAEKLLTPKSSPKGTAKNTPKKVASPKSAKGSPKNNKASPKSNKSSPKSKKVERVVESSSEDDDEPAEFKLGDLVDAEWEDGLYYSARVVKVNKLKSGTTYDVEFTQDGIEVKKLKRNQIQSYSDDDEEEPVKKGNKLSLDDQEYVDGEIPIAEEDASVDPDSAADKPRGKRATATKKTKRGTTLTVAEKKRRLNEGLEELDEDQLVTLVKKASAGNTKVLDALLQSFPNQKKAAKRKGSKK